MIVDHFFISEYGGYKVFRESEQYFVGISFIEKDWHIVTRMPNNGDGYDWISVGKLKHLNDLKDVITTITDEISDTKSLNF